jgi:uncharacterized UBP type Zn finger protein
MELGPTFVMGLKVIKLDKNVKTKIISLGISRIDSNPHSKNLPKFFKCQNQNPWFFSKTKTSQKLWKVENPSHVLSKFWMFDD